MAPTQPVCGEYFDSTEHSTCLIDRSGALRRGAKRLLAVFHGDIAVGDKLVQAFIQRDAMPFNWCQCRVCDVPDVDRQPMPVQ